jgi:glutamate formiminotransferase/formiminotetrahydrofolate cyclodeaminase
MGKSAGVPEAELLETAIRSMGLASVAPFEADRKIIEYAVREAAPLMAMTTSRFVDEVSSESPAPGGGSVAALAGALAAALAAMVANLTVGKKGYEDHWNGMSDLAVRAQAVKERLVSAVDADTQAFSAVMTAMKLPKTSPEEQAVRTAAIQAGNKQAALVPLETARACLDALGLASEALAGNRNSASDAGVAALMACAAVHGAGLNVLINLGSIDDAAFTSGLRVEIAGLRASADSLCDKVVAAVETGFS